MDDKDEVFSSPDVSLSDIVPLRIVPSDYAGVTLRLVQTREWTGILRTCTELYHGKRTRQHCYTIFTQSYLNTEGCRD